MTNEIKREEWKEFLDKLSRERLDWETSVQVLSDESGAQFLSEGLPFVGLTFEEDGADSRIELVVGTSTESHQTHTIVNPRLVAFEATGTRADGTLDIEDESGTKTLVKFTQSLPTRADFAEDEQISKVSKAS